MISGCGVATNAYDLRGRAIAAGKAIQHPSHNGG